VSREAPHALRAVRRILFAAAILGSAVPLDAFASAWHSAPAPPSESVSSGTLAAPTGVSGSCKLFSFRVTLTWTPDPSPLTTGYAILRATAPTGPYSSVGTVSGGSTATFNDPSIAVAANYYYEVESTHLLWSSPPSASANVLTVLGLCT